MDSARVAKSGFSPAELEKNKAPLEAAVAAGDLSGAVTLVWRKGEIAQINTIGKRDVEADLPMTRDTIFRIASMTKPATSVAALMLLEEGRLSLEDPITKWAPEFANMKVLRNAQGPLDEVYPSPRSITIEDLMTHRAGLAYAFTSIGPIAHAHEGALGSPLENDRSPDQWMKALAGLPLSYAPGERFHYSHATDVLAFIVGRIEGKPFRDVLRSRILDPLGMADTDFYVPRAKQTRVAQLYSLDEASGKLQRSEWAANLRDAPAEYVSGGGGLFSTADDYLKFARMLLNEGEVDGVRLLKPETVQMMRANRLTPAQREIPFMGIPFWMGQGFGLGLSVITDPEKQAWMGAGGRGAFGWPGAFGTWWQGDPSEDMIIIYLIQNEMKLGPESASQLATGQRMGARLALPLFQKQTFAAIEG